MKSFAEALLVLMGAAVGAGHRLLQHANLICLCIQALTSLPLSDAVCRGLFASPLFVITLRTRLAGRHRHRVLTAAVAEMHTCCQAGVSGRGGLQSPHRQAL